MQHTAVVENKNQWYNIGLSTHIVKWLGSPTNNSKVRVRCLSPQNARKYS